jgi:hypothetical protein
MQLNIIKEIYQKIKYIDNISILNKNSNHITFIYYNNIIKIVIAHTKGYKYLTVNRKFISNKLISFHKFREIGSIDFAMIDNIENYIKDIVENKMTTSIIKYDMIDIYLKYLFNVLIFFGLKVEKYQFKNKLLIIIEDISIHITILNTYNNQKKYVEIYITNNLGDYLILSPDKLYTIIDLVLINNIKKYIQEIIYIVNNQNKYSNIQKDYNFTNWKCEYCLSSDQTNLASSSNCSHIFHENCITDKCHTCSKTFNKRINHTSYSKQFTSFLIKYNYDLYITLPQNYCINLFLDKIIENNKYQLVLFHNNIATTEKDKYYVYPKYFNNIDEIIRECKDIYYMIFLMPNI